nr:hypothetical protein [Nocardia stercoris]
MIETATARRSVGDWVGACAAAGFDVDIDLRAVRRTRGRELAARVRADLRHLAPDLLRWHMPRIAPDGLLRPGLTIALARYDPPELESHCSRTDSLYLVARTAPAWADAGQRISLALWDRSHTGPPAGRHPHARPDRRFRLDLHRHLWDARCNDELLIRSGAVEFGVDFGSGTPAAMATGELPAGVVGGLSVGPERPNSTAYGGPITRAVAGLPELPDGCAVGTWAAEVRTLIRADGHPGPVLVRLGARRRLVVGVASGDGDSPELVVHHQFPRGSVSSLPILPEAATWMLPDLELLRAGAITVDRLHPLVAQALRPVGVPAETRSAVGSSVAPGSVECRGERHRIGLVDGVLSALDHDPDELRREELLVALTGTPLPCLQVIDRAHRRPDCLAAVRERLNHGDIDGALAVVEELLGPAAALRDGALRDDLEAVARRRITYGLFRAGLSTPGPWPTEAHRLRRRNRGRSHPRLATTR